MNTTADHIATIASTDMPVKLSHAEAMARLAALARQAATQKYFS